MSSLLEEAIVDAKALKEAALKNAEDAVLEKYSQEVKSALSTLLEQEDELDLGGDLGGGDLGGGDLGGDLGGGAPAEPATPADASFLEETPFAFQNEELDAPAQDEIVEIDFDQLKARLEEEEAEGDTGSPADCWALKRPRWNCRKTATRVPSRRKRPKEKRQWLHPTPPARWVPLPKKRIRRRWRQLRRVKMTR